MESSSQGEVVAVEEIAAVDDFNADVVMAAEETAGVKKGPAEYRIIVNAREKIVASDDLTFDQVVALAFDPVPSGPYIEITVVYRKGPNHKRQGALTQGETIEVKDGMIFDVTATDKS
jgi:Multiubiquitin